MNAAIELLNIAEPRPRSMTAEEIALAYQLGAQAAAILTAAIDPDAELAARAEELAEELAETRELLAEARQTAKSLYDYIERQPPPPQVATIRRAVKAEEDAATAWEELATVKAERDELAEELDVMKAERDALAGEIATVKARAVLLKNAAAGIAKERDEALDMVATVKAERDMLAEQRSHLFKAHDDLADKLAKAEASRVAWRDLAEQNEEHAVKMAAARMQDAAEELLADLAAARRTRRLTPRLRIEEKKGGV